MQDIFQEEITYFADVILPVPVPRLFTYRVPREFKETVRVGGRCIVQFGKSKVLTAVVARIHTHPPQQYQAKYILDVLDDYPLVTQHQLNLFAWIAEYYMCCIGEAMNIALPSGLKISSQSKIQYNPDFEYDNLLTEREREILEEIKKHQALSYDELARIADVKHVYHLIKSLVGKKAILVYEEVREKYTPKIITKIRLAVFYEDPENLKALIGELDKAQTQKQLEVLMRYLQNVPVLRSPHLNQKGLDKGIFNRDQEVSNSSLDGLIKKGIFERFEVVVSRFADPDDDKPVILPSLSGAQQKAFEQTVEHFKTKDFVLLHGITGSGKTEIYIRLIQQVLESGSQVLFLLPEIALTTQIVVRLKKIFGEKVGIYHSKFSDNERVEVWKGIVSGRFQFIVGVRSAVFLPFDNLGLIIVDEEHEASYKQYDPAPRYHARDVAMMIALRQHAKVLLGSATPSIESYYQATQGRYGLVELKERFGDSQLPEIELISSKIARQQKRMKGDFVDTILEQLKLNLDAKQQSILFQNRRGYSPFLQCEDCDWIGKCHQCDVSLTYHQYSRELRCHYCGYHENVPRTCPACGSTKVRTKGFGTEKIEDELKIHFPTANIGRMDLDTTRSKTAFQTLIGEVESGKVDMLVGTQMLSKGLDFENVSLVCIFDVDRMINFPDFRSAERAFQLITQVSGRAGRREKQGKVLIQAANVDNPLLQKIINNDYDGLFKEEIAEREAFRYPPFTRLIRLTVKHLEQDIAKKASQSLANKLSDKLSAGRVLGPETPLIERIRNYYYFEILLKLERDLNIKGIKEFLGQSIEEILTEKDYKNTNIVVDVDCM
jgi:primosomal protein N' (replication factor Y) (superfamily II helicase)